MTEITKPFRRKTRLPFAHYKRRIVIILKPLDVIEMRLERTRTVYRAEIASVFRLLAQWHAFAELRRKKDSRLRSRKF